MWHVAVVTIAVALGVYYLMSSGNTKHSPSYTVLKKLGDGVEVRHYQSAIVAQVQITGNPRDALNEGFRVLAGYIFGKNTRTKSLSGTSRVLAQPEKIKMTSPVTAQSTGNTTTVSFFMPRGYSLQTLPEPEDSRIHFFQIPERNLAAIGFSGFWNPQSFSKHAQSLLERLRLSNLQTVGEPFNAYYDPPFVPPFMRRNEVLISIAD
jgi:hypothetical protein